MMTGMGAVERAALCVLLAYLVGSVCFGVLLGRRKGVDLRAVGSGNVGATNVGRVLGKRAAWTVGMLDALKGAAAVLAAEAALAHEGAEMRVTAGAAAGLAAVVGHVLPVWHRFRGGKGVATAFGVLVALVPWLGGAAMLVFLAAKRALGYTSAASLSALGVVAGAAWFLWPPADARPWLLSALLALLTATHRENLQRLREGKELAP